MTINLIKRIPPLLDTSLTIIEPSSDADCRVGPDLPYTAADWGCGKYWDQVIVACGNNIFVLDQNLNTSIRLLVWPTGLGVHHLNWFTDNEILVGFNSTEFSSSLGFVSLYENLGCSQLVKGAPVQMSPMQVDICTPSFSKSTARQRYFSIFLPKW